jgi:type II secretory ATPase GspE/PulE/Tfp pilus assembly ATPase PilB-like protein
LLDLGIPDYLVAATVEGVLAQRLVRRICPDCRVEYEPSSESVAAVAGRSVGVVKLVRGAGCGACRGTGFRGRLGVFELMLFTDEVRDAITRHVSRSQLRSLAIEAGLFPLRNDGWEKVQSGLTSIEEVLRVVQE